MTTGDREREGVSDGLKNVVNYTQYEVSNTAPEQTYPMAYSRPLSDCSSDEDKSGRKGPKLPCKLYSMALPTGWYAAVGVGSAEIDLLVDSGASKTCFSRELYNRLPGPKPELLNTNMKFEMADGTIHSAAGVCHFPMVIKFGEHIRVNKVPVYICDFMSKGMDGVLGCDAGKRLKFSLGLGNGKLYRLDKDDRVLPGEPHVCRERPRRDGEYFATLARTTTIPAYTVMTAEISTRNIGLTKDSPDLFMAKPVEKIWDDHGIWAIRGVVSRKQGPVPMFLFNTTDDDVILKGGVEMVSLHETQGCVVTGRKTRSNAEISGDGASVFSRSMFSVVPVDPEDKLTRKDKRSVARLFGLKCMSQEGDDDSDMSGLDEDMDLMIPPTKEPRKVPLKEGELQEQVQFLLNDCKDRLSDDQWQKTYELLRTEHDSFMDPSKDLIGTDAVAHYIDTGNSRPIRVPPRRIPPGRRQIIEEEIEKMLEQGIIRESKSPWSSPVVLVKKKDGSTRFCIDYRQLNQVTKKNSYPIPRIDETLESLRGNSWFCTLDLASGYWQVKMADGDREKTAFASHMGLYEFNRMPFGLTNAPATFQSLMEQVLRGYIGRKCMLYLDDVIVFGKTFDECYENLRDVVQRFSRYNLKLKAKKCELFMREVSFLGHVVSERGIKCDPKKIEKIMALEPATNKTGIRAILGLGNYYRRFIKDFGAIVEPLQRLTRKDVQFEWGEEQQESLDKLKEAFCSAPILAYPDFELGNFIVDTDASNYAIGGVLSQVQDGEERVIMYASKAMAGSQLRWCTTRRELWAIFYCISRPFSYYLESDQSFVLRTDHSALRWIYTMTGKTKDGAISRWLMYLQPIFQRMKVEYRKGEDHGNADALSRFVYSSNTRSCPNPECPDKGHKATKNKYSSEDVADLKILAPVMTRNQVREAVGDSDCAVVASFSNEKVKDCQRQDPELSRFIELLGSHTEKPRAKLLSSESSEVRIMCGLWPQFRVVDNILYRIGKIPEDPWRLVIPRELRKEIMEMLHDSKWAGHPGMSRMKASLGSRYYWPRMREDIESWVKCCRACAMAKRGKGRGKAPLIQELSGAPFQRVAFDVIGPLPRTKSGKRFILVMVDYYTKWAEAYDLENHTAITVAHTIATRWISLYGTPLRLHCDNAPEFRGHVLRQLREVLGIRGTFSSPYRPKSNGLCERTNQTIEGILRAMIQDKRDEWDTALPFAMMSYRATPHSSTNYSPNMLCFGRENTMPADIVFGQTGMRVPTPNGCYCEYVDWLRKAMVDSYCRARLVMGAAARRQKIKHDEDTAPRHFKVGDWVLYFHKPSSNQTLNSGWSGPWVVTKKLSPVNYILQKNEADGGRIAHCDELQMDIYPERTNWVRIELARRKRQQQIEDRSRCVVDKFDAQTQTEELPLADAIEQELVVPQKTKVRRGRYNTRQKIKARKDERLALKIIAALVK